MRTLQVSGEPDLQDAKLLGELPKRPSDDGRAGVKILLADPDSDLLDLTTYVLGQHGYKVIAARDGTQALRRWHADRPHLVVANSRLTGRSGFEVCREIRQQSQTPIILLGEHYSEDDIIHGFELGADDYVSKPFSHRLLLLRIRAVLSRSGVYDLSSPISELIAGDLQLDLESHEVRRGDLRIRLTPLEFRVLYLLARHAGRVVSSDRLIQYAWGSDDADASMLRIHVSRIRQKLKLPANGPGSIGSIRWVGYVLRIAQST